MAFEFEMANIAIGFKRFVIWCNEDSNLHFLFTSVETNLGGIFKFVFY